MRQFGIGISLLALLVVEGSAAAAGLENSVMWSGKYAGYGGAAVSSVTGSQSIYFNPAGLATPGDISLNYSPTWINEQGDLLNSTISNQSNSGLVSSGAGFVSYKWDKFGLGAGAYLVAGGKSEYDNLNLQNLYSNATTAITPTEQANFTLMEYAIGGAIEISPGFRIGVAGRFTQATVNMQTLMETTGNTALTTLVISNATDSSAGVRIGAMYDDPTNKWGLGVSYRSQETFNAAGTGSGQTIVISSNSIGTNTVANTAIGFVLPAMFSAGAHYTFDGGFRLLGGVDYAQYSNEVQLTMTGTSNGTQIPNIPLNWSNMVNVRIGAEYTGFQNVALRAGYVYTSQVTNTNNAKAIYAPPGVTNSVTAGIGYTVQKNIDLDGAFQYAYSSGSGSMTTPQSTDQLKEILNGQSTTTMASVYALHLGGTYRF